MAAVCCGVWQPAHPPSNSAATMTPILPGWERPSRLTPQSGEREGATTGNGLTPGCRRKGMAWGTTASPRGSGGLGKVQAGGTIANQHDRSRAVHRPRHSPLPPGEVPLFSILPPLSHRPVNGPLFPCFRPSFLPGFPLPTPIRPRSWMTCGASRSGWGFRGWEWRRRPIAIRVSMPRFAVGSIRGSPARWPIGWPGTSFSGVSQTAC